MAIPLLKYYFDGSDAVATDPNSVWTNDNNAFSGDINTNANTTTQGDTSSNYLMAEGTNAPGSGNDILNVRARISGGTNTSRTSEAVIYTDGLAESLGTLTWNDTVTGPKWGNYTVLTTPSGGWTWPTLQALEVKVYCSSAGVTGCFIYQIEIEVNFVEGTPGRIYRIQGFQ